VLKVETGRLDRHLPRQLCNARQVHGKAVQRARAQRTGPRGSEGPEGASFPAAGWASHTRGQPTCQKCPKSTAQAPQSAVQAPSKAPGTPLAWSETEGQGSDSRSRSPFMMESKISRSLFPQKGGSPAAVGACARAVGRPAGARCGLRRLPAAPQLGGSPCHTQRQWEHTTQVGAARRADSRAPGLPAQPAAPLCGLHTPRRTAPYPSHPTAGCTAPPPGSRRPPLVRSFAAAPAGRHACGGAIAALGVPGRPPGTAPLRSRQRAGCLPPREREEAEHTPRAPKPPNARCSDRRPRAAPRAAPRHAPCPSAHGAEHSRRGQHSRRGHRSRSR
jgi:hypothetical protein